MHIQPLTKCIYGFFDIFKQHWSKAKPICKIVTWGLLKEYKFTIKYQIRKNMKILIDVLPSSLIDSNVSMKEK
jgi:hypothetical protein